jgi:hypothetical protein
MFLDLDLWVYLVNVVMKWRFEMLTENINEWLVVVLCFLKHYSSMEVEVVLMQFKKECDDTTFGC